MFTTPIVVFTKHITSPRTTKPAIQGLLSAAHHHFLSAHIQTTPLRLFLLFCFTENILLTNDRQLQVSVPL